MKTENMTFSEALEAMKKGYKVRRTSNNERIFKISGTCLIDECDGLVEWLHHDYLFATDWEIYNEPKPEPQFEIGELVMMRANCKYIWFPQYFARAIDGLYQSINGSVYEQCAKFDKNIVFTNKPAK